VKAQKVIALTRELMALLGIDDNRLRLEWISSAEGGRFAEVMTEFTRQLKEQGSFNQRMAS
jgi:F420-non-reducing hydrogenase iron-sulfur subunit